MENENNAQNTTAEAGREMHHNAPGVSTLVAPGLNLLILLFIFVYYLRQPIRDFVAGRHTGLRDEMSKVRDQLRSAQAQYDEFTAKLKAIDAEISALHEQSRQDAQATKLRILSAGQKLSATIVTDARAAAQAVFADLKTKLFGEIGARVLDRAENIMRDRLTGDDRVRIRREFSTQVESVQ